MLSPDLDPKNFCPAHGFCVSLCQEVIARAACLYLTDPQETALYTLLAAKGEGAYTRLVISNGVCAEKLVMYMSAGAIRLCAPLKQNYPAGSSLIYETTQEAISDMVACATAEAAEPTEEDQVPKIQGQKFTGFDENGAPCYEAIPPDCEFIVDGKKITISDGVITCCDVPADEMSETCEDGTYCGINSITLKDGKITSISACEFSKSSTESKNIDPSAAGVATC